MERAGARDLGGKRVPAPGRVTPVTSIPWEDESGNHDLQWGLREWTEYVSLCPELVKIARSIQWPLCPHDVIAFQVAMAASRAKRTVDSTAPGIFPCERIARAILLAYRPVAEVVSLDTRRGPALAKRLGLELEAVSIESVVPPSLRK